VPIILSDNSEAQIPRDIPRVRAELKMPGGECLGCYLGDASPDLHDIPDACEYFGGFVFTVDENV